jgi:RsiW-degrading membrane proteinase PrsW (M82 family)
MSDAQTLLLPARRRSRRRNWWRVLLSILAAYFAGIGVLVLTGNPNLFPTVIMLGSFMVPITYVVFLYDHGHFAAVGLGSIALTFVYGGVLGTFAASLLEPLFVSHLDLATAMIVGVIEEFAKILGVLVIARRRRHDSQLAGILLGAAAGMGFAAFESSGYAFTAFLRSGGSASAAVGVTMLRGIFSPLGHGTWTAIFASVLFRESAPRRFRVNLAVVRAYLLVVLLHGLWDGLPGFLAMIVSSGVDILLAQLAIGAAGLWVLWRRWREAVRPAVPPAPAAEAQEPARSAEPAAPGEPAAERPVEE